MTGILQSGLGLFAMAGIALMVLYASIRRIEIVALGIKSIVAGTLATLMTGAIIGCLWN